MVIMIMMMVKIMVMMMVMIMVIGYDGGLQQQNEGEIEDLKTLPQIARLVKGRFSKQISRSLAEKKSSAGNGTQGKAESEFTSMFNYFFQEIVLC